MNYRQYMELSAECGPWSSITFPSTTLPILEPNNCLTSSRTVPSYNLFKLSNCSAVIYRALLNVFGASIIHNWLEGFVTSLNVGIYKEFILLIIGIYKEFTLLIIGIYKEFTL